MCSDYPSGLTLIEAVSHSTCAIVLHRPKGEHHATLVIPYCHRTPIEWASFLIWLDRFHLYRSFLSSNSAVQHVHSHLSTLSCAFATILALSDQCALFHWPPGSCWSAQIALPISVFNSFHFCSSNRSSLSLNVHFFYFGLSLFLTNNLHPWQKSLWQVSTVSINNHIEQNFISKRELVLSQTESCLFLLTIGGSDRFSHLLLIENL